ncbi:MAG TPA: multicopper oxidase domain-containing protein [Symbiobacteriaceae bacterium]|nr:multicopper oxidase domain-containing protein [Symbiobacteriaceae bacterium]
MVTARRLGATDGVIQTPDGGTHYVFGFVDLTGVPEPEIYAYRGKAELPAPLVVAAEGEVLQLTLTNLGLPGRPDLDDTHTIHFHGFPNQIPLYDGVPEASISVPVGRDFTYHYLPLDPGTYMYHCHFEPVEHIQMGMVGPLVVRPQSGDHFAYNDPATAFDREYFIFLTELDPDVHAAIAAVQEFDWTDYRPQYWLLNGRSYPDTLLPGVALPAQRYSSLIQANQGEHVLLRFINLGYQQHAIRIAGIPLTVIGLDAQPLGSLLTQRRSVIYTGAGQTADVLFTAPAPGEYPLMSRSYHRNNVAGFGPGGMLTTVRIHPAGTLGPQTGPNA